jgi:hypothetical protein
MMSIDELGRRIYEVGLGLQEPPASEDVRQVCAAESSANVLDGLSNVSLQAARLLASRELPDNYGWSQFVGLLTSDPLSLNGLRAKALFATAVIAQVEAQSKKENNPLQSMPASGHD